MSQIHLQAQDQQWCTFELEINCTLIEMDIEHFELIKQIENYVRFYGLKIVE